MHVHGVGGESGEGGEGGESGDDGGDSGGDGDGGGAACAQTSHPARVTLPSEDHVKAPSPNNTLRGPIVPLYVAPLTISSS